MPPRAQTRPDPDPAAPPAGPALDVAMLEVLRGVDAALDPEDPEALAHAVRDFQAAHDLDASGQLDESTIEALAQAAVAASTPPERPDLKRGATGQAVMDLQRLIVAPQTGAFDADTERRVRRVQSAAGLPQTGEVDSATWDAALKRAKS